MGYFSIPRINSTTFRQTSVSNQTRRIQALDAVLVGLGALQVAGLAYIGTDRTWLGRCLVVVLAACAGLYVVGIAGFGGVDGPDQGAYRPGLVKQGREKTRCDTAIGLEEDYNENSRPIWAKSEWYASEARQPYSGS